MSSSKSKADKQLSESLVKTTLLEQDQKDKHTIRGHLIQAQWTNILIQEDTDEAVAEIIDELLAKVMGCCYKVDINGQLMSFTLFWIKSYLTQTVEHQMLFLDEGEEEVEITKTEDSEPVPATPDSWAQGCVPVVDASHQPHHTSLQEVNTGQVPVQTGASVKKKCSVTLKKSALKHSDIEDSRSPQIPCNVLSALPKLKTGKKSQWVNSAPKNVPGQLLPSQLCSSEKKNIGVESKNNQSSIYKQKTSSAHHHRDQESIQKLDPSSLPRHFILTEYEIVDNNLSKVKPKKFSGLVRPRPTLNRQVSECTVTSSKSQTSFKEEPKQFQKRKDDNVRPSEHQKEQHMSSRPLDTVMLEKSISQVDLEAVSNPLKLNYSLQSTTLKPVQNKPAVPLFSVDQVTASPQPKIPSLFQSRNCDKRL